MGVLTDLVAAEESEAEAVASSGGPLQRWPGIDAKGIDLVKLAKLLSIISAEPYRNALVGEFVQVAEASEDGPWVFRMPPRLVSSLSELGPGEISRHAKQWSTAEEFAHGAWEEASVAEIVASLCELARRAVAEGKSLLIWMCL